MATGAHGPEGATEAVADTSPTASGDSGRPSSPPRRDLRSIFRAVVWMTGSGYVDAGLTVLRGLLFARILGPYSYGVWGFLSTVQSLSVNSDLGVGQVVSRDLPRALAAGDERRAATLATLTRVWTTASCLFVGVALAILWPVLRWPSSAGWPVLVPLLLFGMSFYVTAQTVERGSMAFRRLALLITLAGAVALVAGVAASLTFGITGLAISQALVYGAAGLIALARRPGTTTRTEFGRGWLDAVGQGWRLLLPSFALQVFVSVDILVVAWAFTPGSVGIYAVALMGSTMAAGVVASGVSTVAGQHLLKETANAEAGMPSAMVWGPAAAVAVVLAPACAVAILLTPTVFAVLLPNYVGAIAPALVLLAAAYYLHSQFGFSTTFIAAGRPTATVPLYAALVPLNVALDLLLIRQGFGLLAVAAGSLAVNILFMLMHEALVAFRVSRGPRQYAQILATLAAGGLPVAAASAVLGYTPGAWGAAVVGVVGWFGLVAIASRWLGSHLPTPWGGRHIGASGRAKG
ncbi:MAG TPA: oligosaccharide flippase family protein, partial [Candidatus Limnocylindrales bacterium]